jgi:lipoprotein-releasing system permease protein
LLLIKPNALKIEYFIAKRLISTKDYKSSISAPIIKIAITAIALGMIMMIISIGTSIGLQQKIRQKVAAFNGHIQISGFNTNNSDVSAVPISTKQDFYPTFTTVSGINHIQGIAAKAGIIRTEDAFEGIIYKGVGKDYVWKDLSEYLINGRIPNVTADLNTEVLISQYLVNRLNLKLNDSFNTFFMKDGENKLPNSRRFKIVGIYNSGFEEFDATYLIGDIRHIQRFNKWNENQVGSFEGQEVYKAIPSNLESKTILDKFYYIFDWLKLFDFNLVVILVIMIAVSTINMVVALLVLILERTQMVGILKALGANNWTVRKVFLYNAFYLIVRGLFWGNSIAIGLLLIQKYFGIIQLNPESYYVREAPVDINLLHILALNVGTVAICLLVLIIPSVIITKISPAKTIRFE